MISHVSNLLKQVKSQRQTKCVFCSMCFASGADKIPTFKGNLRKGQPAKRRRGGGSSDYEFVIRTI